MNMKNDLQESLSSAAELINQGTKLVGYCETIGSPYDCPYSLQELLDTYFDWKKRVHTFLENDPFKARSTFRLNQVEKTFEGTVFDFDRKKLLVSSARSAAVTGAISRRAKEISLILGDVHAQEIPHESQNEDIVLDEKHIEFKLDPCKLYCSATKEEQTFPKDHQKASILIRAAFDGANPPGEWIGLLSEGVEDNFEGRQLYDAGRTINRAFRNTFKIDGDLFLLDFANNQVKLNLDAPQFTLSQT